MFFNFDKRFNSIRPTDVTKEVYDLKVLEWIDEVEEVEKIIQYGARVAYQEGLINQNKDTRQKRFFMSGEIASIYIANGTKYVQLYW